DKDAVLRLRNLTRNVTAEHLREIFGYYGEVVKVDLAVDSAVGLSKGTATVEMAKRQQAEEAVRHMDGGQLDSNRVGVSL
ncbi:hypothetical protein EMIHUDRAFT_49436, partial [Emiliania huxleyi CCMP1516]|uniref:RRM domain-containing protein n=3 Tax=Emiliania huxleyi TaxID=2903 RepID=A0A0D3K9M3_EMIH1